MYCHAAPDAKEDLYLNNGYRAFLKEQDPSEKEDAGRNLIPVVFENDAIAEDRIL